MPIAASSAMIAEMVSAGVSPGMTIISRPTEHTAVIASSFSMPRHPVLAAFIMPASSVTGMKAPDNPPTEEDAITPPFFTASLSIASAAVVPCVPHCSRPISSRIYATESPTAGVGAKDKSMMPKGTPSIREASVPTSCPIRVILKAVFLISSATSCSGASSGSFARAARTTPGPETPTLSTTSGSPTPWKAPAMNGLSSGALQNTTSFAAPMHWLSFVSSDAFLTTSPIIATASMLIPAFVEPMLTDEHTNSVSASARGIASISSRSPALKPFCTKALKPPIKFTPTALAARSSVFAYFTGSPPLTARSMEIGVTLILLFTIGIPYFFSMNSPVATKSFACE